METAETPDLDELARRAAGADHEALEDLLAAIQPRVRRICGRMLLYPEDAEEATQDALLRVATKIDTFDGRSRFTTWL
ncbi:MAG TPA: sigma factor, partial [Marmoricola sp.]